MELLREIDDNENGEIEKERTAARGVFFDDKDNIPVLFVSKYNYHKLPGGGAKDGEDLKETLDREVFEETGCGIEVIGEVGKIIEYRRRWNMKQDSFCYYGKIIQKGDTSFTEKETEQGFILKWMTLTDALRVIEKDKPKNYEGKLIQKRDLIFLKKTKDILTNN